MADVQDVAAAILDRCGSMTAMKLEKLVYYCQCWHLARAGQALFSDPIEAWKQGPVVPALYQKHRGTYTVNHWPHGDASLCRDGIAVAGAFRASGDLLRRPRPWALVTRGGSRRL